MPAYRECLALSKSHDSEERARAAHLAATAFLQHQSQTAEQASLYALLIVFLDDPSVKVRAALAYALLQSPHAPRTIIIALLQDSAIIARAVAQYSPVLVDADLIGLVAEFDLPMLVAVAQRGALSARLAAALLARKHYELTLRILRRSDIAVDARDLVAAAANFSEQGAMRGALLARHDLPPSVRLDLVRQVSKCLRQTRLVAGALAPDRLERLLRNCADSALAEIGEQESSKDAPRFVAGLVEEQRLSLRVLLHAVVTGRGMFFVDCLSELTQVAPQKIFALLETGSHAALRALFIRCGLGQGAAELLQSLVVHARTTDLAHDILARHWVVTALIEDVVIRYDAVIPHDLEEAFAYLNEQNVVLAKQAAREVTMMLDAEHQTPVVPDQEQRLLPAA